MSFCQGLVSRVVLISSQDVYRAYGRVNRTEVGPPDALPITEDLPLRENSTLIAVWICLFLRAKSSACTIMIRFPLSGS